MATSLAKKPQLRKLLCIGRQKENERGAAPRSHDGGEGNQGDGEDLGLGIKFMARDLQMWREHVAALQTT